jgi:signal peptidase I
MKYFLREWGLFFVVLIGIVLLRYFFWFAVKVDGHSMDPTLAQSERLIVVKHTKLERGDIVVANEVDETTGETKSIVKRLIGMPGDKISFNNDVLTINGKVVAEPYLETYQKLFAKDKLQATYAYDTMFQELAKNSVAFTTDDGNPNFTAEVPLNQYYLLGDDRIVSNDSRNVGTFAKSAILGEVKFRYWPFKEIGFLG